MNEKLIKKMRKAHKKQTDEIHRQPGWKAFSDKFDREYALAVEIHEARKAANLSQIEIAKKMNTTQSVVSRIENGTNISIATLAKYADALDKKLEIHLV